ncbi:MAG: LamG domain-containing protein, partial [Planctomycetota bacterium]
MYYVTKNEIVCCHVAGIRHLHFGYWPFDENQGTTAADITGNGNDGAFNGGVEWVAGFKGSGVHFDTGGERVVIGPLDPTAGTDAMTLAAWINWEGEGHETITHQGIFGKRLGWDPDNNHPTTKWFWEVQPDGDMVFRNGGAAVNWTNGLMTPYPNEWVHVALTWDNGATVQYINGEEVETGNITFRDTADDTPVTIGCVDSTNSETFVGIIDEARIYNHALRPDEIQTIMLGIFPTAFSPNPADG